METLRFRDWLMAEEMMSRAAKFQSVGGHHLEAEVHAARLSGLQ